MALHAVGVSVSEMSLCSRIFLTFFALRRRVILDLDGSGHGGASMHDVDELGAPDGTIVTERGC